MSPIDPLTGDEQGSTASALAAIIIPITYLDASPDFIIPKYSYVANVRMHITVAFSAGATAKVGNDGDDDAYSTSIAIDSTGVKSLTAGVGVGYDSTSRRGLVTIGGSPTAGAGIVIIEFYRTPRIN